MSMIVKLALVLLGAYAFLVAFLWAFQERLVLPGPRRPLPEPSSIGFEHGRKVTVTAHDGTELNGWYLPPALSSDDRAPGLIWFYGNMETLGTLADVFSYLKPRSLGLLALDYRGYGENRGRATEAAIEEDGEVAWEFMRSRPEIDSTRISVYGRSIGSTVAMHLASLFPVSAVALDSPMSTARDVAAVHYWFFPRFLMRMKLDNVGRAADVKAPVLVIHGARDRIIPLWMGRAVADAAPHGRLTVMSDAGHNSTFASDPKKYRALLWRHLGFDETGSLPTDVGSKP